jgi:hypothetical protein
MPLPGQTHIATAHTLVVIPCGRAKHHSPTVAQELYTGAAFSHFLTCAVGLATDDAQWGQHRTDVVIMSALHGLVDLDTVIAPYDQTIVEKGPLLPDWTLVDQLVSRAPRVIMAMLPGRYLRRLETAVQYVNYEGSEEDPWIEVLDTFEAGVGHQFGIGWQRGKAAMLRDIACV